MATSFSGGRSRITTDHGQETGKLYPCGCESSAPFFVIHKAVLMIGLYELVGNPTT